MKKAKIFKPSKTVMQSGLGKLDKWVMEFKTKIRGVAQPGSASGLGPEGRRFKSCRPDHNYEKSNNIQTFKNTHAIGY